MKGIACDVKNLMQKLLGSYNNIISGSIVDLANHIKNLRTFLYDFNGSLRLAAKGEKLSVTTSEKKIRKMVKKKVTFY